MKSEKICASSEVEKAMETIVKWLFENGKGANTITIVLDGVELRTGNIAWSAHIE